MLPEIMTQMVVGIDEPSNVCSGSNGSSGEEEKSIAIAERGNLEKWSVMKMRIAKFHGFISDVLK